MNPSPRFLMAICTGLLLVGFCPRAAAGQSIVDRIKKAAEDAKKKGEAKPPATTPSGTTPAQPNGAGPATPATPAKKADSRPAALMDSSGVVSTAARGKSVRTAPCSWSGRPAMPWSGSG